MGRVVELGISGRKCLNCQITRLLAILIGLSTRTSHIPQRVFPRPERGIIISSFLCICEVLYTKPLFFTGLSLVPTAYFYCVCPFAHPAHLEDCQLNLLAKVCVGCWVLNISTIG